MWLYVVGAVILQLNVLSGLWKEYTVTGSVSLAGGLYAAELSFFICEYM
jgi:hypothetical protein